MGECHCEEGHGALELSSYGVDWRWNDICRFSDFYTIRNRCASVRVVTRRCKDCNKQLSYKRGKNTFLVTRELLYKCHSRHLTNTVGWTTSWTDSIWFHNVTLSRRLVYYSLVSQSTTRPYASGWLDSYVLNNIYYYIIIQCIYILTPHRIS